VNVPDLIYKEVSKNLRQSTEIRYSRHNSKYLNEGFWLLVDDLLA
jgi:hypothetical protein